MTGERVTGFDRGNAGVIALRDAAEIVAAADHVAGPADPVVRIAAYCKTHCGGMLGGNDQPMWSIGRRGAAVQTGVEAKDLVDGQVGKSGEGRQVNLGVELVDHEGRAHWQRGNL